MSATLCSIRKVILHNFMVNYTHGVVDGEKVL